MAKKGKWQRSQVIVESCDEPGEELIISETEPAKRRKLSQKEADALFRDVFSQLESA